MPEQPPDWFWEGNVQTAVARHLVEEGWSIESQADTASRQAGVDIVAVRGTDKLAVEVKGYPTTTYARGRLAGTTKPTQPATQARQWFSHASLSALLLVSNPSFTHVALAFPDFTTFRSLASRTRPALERLDVVIYLVREDGGTHPVGDFDGNAPGGG